MWRTAQGAYLVRTNGEERPATPWLRSYLAASAAKTAVRASDSERPERFTLEGAYPNPFNPAATIRFALPETAHVTLTVYDALGREITRLVDRSLGAGRHQAVFEAGARPGGLYLYRLQARTADGARFDRTGRAVLLK